MSKAKTRLLFLLIVFSSVFTVINAAPLILPSLAEATIFHLRTYTNYDIQEVWLYDNEGNVVEYWPNLTEIQEWGTKYEVEVVFDITPLRIPGNMIPYHFEWMQRTIPASSPTLVTVTSYFDAAVNHSSEPDQTSYLWFSDVSGSGTWDLLLETFFIFDKDGWPTHRFEQIYRGPDNQLYLYRPVTYDLYLLSEAAGRGFYDAEELIDAPAIVDNDPPVCDAGGPYSGYEGSPITLDASGSYDPDDTIILYEWDLDNDGVYDTPGETMQHAWPDGPASHMVGLMVTDSHGLSDTCGALVNIDNVCPSLDPIFVSSALVEVGTSINASAAFTDPGTDDTHTADWDWDDGTVETQENVSDPAAHSHTYDATGVYTIELTVTDKDGCSVTEIYQYVVVYDPNDGFVTGGGWIDSPAGAYTADPNLTGKATFGFASKYKRKDPVPSGNTEFQFHAADLNFHSDTYDWLVIAGYKAMYKGTGTINGEGNYGFMLFAIDAKPHPVWDVDRFRIQIWDSGDAIVYDNELSSAMDTDPTTEIQGGSIVIHKK